MVNNQMKLVKCGKIVIHSDRISERNATQTWSNSSMHGYNHNINNYNIHLITILVLDDYQEGIPAAYVVCNWEDIIAILCILESIKLKCKGFKSCLLFMSDISPQC